MEGAMLNLPVTNQPLRGDYSGAAADFTIDQGWSDYRGADHALWRRLYERQAKLMPDYACREFIDSLKAMHIANGIPNLDAVSRQLVRATGWRLVAVPGLVPNDVFFAHLARRQFPVTNWIRKPEEIDYLVEPDIFHDFFGHVPLLFNPIFADYMQAYGIKGKEAERLDATTILARLYWYMVEFGLIQTPEGIRAYGAGMLSSHAETVFSVDDASPHRIGFALDRVMQTNFRIDDFQETYFVLENFEQLFQATKRDFRPVYQSIKSLAVLEPDTLLPTDRVISRGTGNWKARHRPNPLHA